MAVHVRPYKPGKYGKGTIPDEEHPEAQIWRTKGGWDGDPHHDDVSEALGNERPMVTFHIDRAGRFYFHHSGDGHLKPTDPGKLAKAVQAQHPELRWGGESVEQHEASGKTLAMNGRPLRDFERGAHLHVLDWTHSTARHRLQAAGAVQVKAAAKAVVDRSFNNGPPELPSLEAAITLELRKLWALGHATVRSELDHQSTGEALPIGLSAAPVPPNLRQAKGAKKRCGTCKMFDAGQTVCWGYGNYGVEPDELCDSWAAEDKVRTLATVSSPGDPSSLRARARLIAQDTAHRIFQAVHRARLQGVTGRRALKQAGRDAGHQALAEAATRHAGGAINAGRHAAANRSGVIGARYTSILDKRTCGPCAEADTGQLLSLDDPALIHPPNPNCLGGDRCRCILVYQLQAEGRPSTPDAPQDGGVDVRPVAAVGVGSS